MKWTRNNPMATPITSVACPVCGVRMPEAEVNVHLDLCLFEQMEREEAAEAARLRKQQKNGEQRTGARSASERKESSAARPEQQRPLSQPPSFTPTFPAVPSHPPASLVLQHQPLQPLRPGQPYTGFPLLQPHGGPPLTDVSAHRTGAQNGTAVPPQSVPYLAFAPGMNGVPPGFPATGQNFPPASVTMPYQSIPPASITGDQPPSTRPPFIQGQSFPGQYKPGGSQVGDKPPVLQPYPMYGMPPQGAFQPPFAAPQLAHFPPQTAQTTNPAQQPQPARYPPTYFPPPQQSQYPAQQFYTAPQLSAQYQAFLQKYQSLQQNQSFSQYPQILQRTPSQQGLLAAQPSQTAREGRGDQQERTSHQPKEQSVRKPSPLESSYYEYCEGWVYVCERPTVRFVKTWVVLKEAGLHLFDAPTERNTAARLVIPLVTVRAFLLDAQKNTGKRHSFGLQCKNAKIFYFATRSADEIQPWLQSVRKELRRISNQEGMAPVKEIVPTVEPASQQDQRTPVRANSTATSASAPISSPKSTPVASPTADSQTGRTKSKEIKARDKSGAISGLFAKLSSMASGASNDKVYKLLDAEFLEDMKIFVVEEGKTLSQQQLDSQKVKIFTHMNKVFGLYSHPLGRLMLDFIDEFVKHKDRIRSARPSTALAKITQEILTFLDRLVVTVEHYYGGEVAHLEMFPHTSRLAAEHCIFSSLYDIIYPVYLKRYITEDSKFKAKMTEFADITTSDLIDNPKFWLLDDKQGPNGKSATEPYHKAINMLAAITELATPVAKLNCLVDTSRIICGCINEYWTKRDPATKEIAVSCDDLLPILLYVLIKSKLGSVHTESMYMQDFIGEREQMQIEGYSLATFQAASAALLCLERDSLRKDRQEESVTAASDAANQPSPATSPALTPPQPSAPSSSQPTTETSPTASSSTADSAESQQENGGGAGHRPKRMSWINAVLAKQAAITHEVQQTTSQEEEGEEGEEWTLFTTAPATNIDHHSSDNELDEGEQVHEEDLLKDDAQDFLDTFHVPTSTSPARPSQPPTTGNLLIDWGDSDSTSAAKSPNETSSSSSSSSSTEA